MTDSDTPSQLKDAIDRGQTGDKVHHPDPSASPLGTDSEAGGTPASQGEASTARGLEAQVAAGAKTDPSRTRSSTFNPMGLPVLLAILAAAALGAALWFSLT